MKKGKKLSILIMKLYFIFTYIVVFLGCNSEKNNNQNVKPLPVKLAKVSYEDISLSIHSCGVLSSKKEMRLSFKTGGIIDKIYVKEGKSVKKGTLLAKLKLEEIQAKVIQAQNAMDKAERDLERVFNLFADSVATLEQKQDTETALNIAEANLKIAQFNLDHSKIIAPANGKVFKQFVEENELIAPGIPAFYFGSIGEKWMVKVGITDREIIHIQFGDSAHVFFDLYPNTIFPAFVTEVTEAADPMTGTYEVNLEIKQRNYRLMSGFVATVNIFSSTKQKLFLIPIEALVEADKDQGYVYIPFEDSKIIAKKIPVTIGSIYKEKIVISSGLENIEQVITKGSAYLEDGIPIEIIN